MRTCGGDIRLRFLTPADMLSPPAPFPRWGVTVRIIHVPFQISIHTLVRESCVPPACMLPSRGTIFDRIHTLSLGELAICNSMQNYFDHRGHLPSPNFVLKLIHQVMRTPQILSNFQLTLHPTCAFLRETTQSLDWSSAFAIMVGNKTSN